MAAKNRTYCQNRFSTFTLGIAVATTVGPTIPPTPAADDLKLRSGVSFTQDIDSGFPITGTNMDDTHLDPAMPTLIFFGAAGDLNTNRQAKRLVDMYHKLTPKTVKFIVIDVDHADSVEAKKIVKDYYRGYIPCQVLLDKSGKSIWSQTGEVDSGVLKGQLNKVL